MGSRVEGWWGEAITSWHKNKCERLSASIPVPEFTLGLAGHSSFLSGSLTPSALRCLSWGCGVVDIHHSSLPWKRLWMNSPDTSPGSSEGSLGCIRCWFNFHYPLPSQAALVFLKAGTAAKERGESCVGGDLSSACEGWGVLNLCETNSFWLLLVDLGNPSSFLSPACLLLRQPGPNAPSPLPAAATCANVMQVPHCCSTAVPSDLLGVSLLWRQPLCYCVRR